MLDYQTPFRQAGSLAGGVAGAAGGGLLGRLGDLMAPLDYPRQALWNTVRSGARALSGDGSWDDLAAAAPGLAGLAVTGGLAATGVGLPLAVLGGSVLGGAGQAIGKSTGNEAFNAATPEDVTGVKSDTPAGFVANTALGMLGDPLTYAGGLGGAAKGGEAGANLGRSLEPLGLARGPRYPGGSEKLADLLGVSSSLNSRFHDFVPTDPGKLQQLLHEIPPGTKFLGQGIEGVGALTPDGDVLRFGTNALGTGHFHMLEPPPARPDVAGLIQPTRDKVVGNVRMERVPRFATMPKDLPVPERYAAKEALRNQLNSQGWSFWDSHAGNWALMPDGSPVVSDPGAIEPMHAALSSKADTSQWVPPRTEERLTSQQPSWLQNKLLDLMGNDARVQQGLHDAAAPSRALPPVGDVAGPYAHAGDSVETTPGRLAGDVPPPRTNEIQQQIQRAINGGQPEPGFLDRLRPDQDLWKEAASRIDPEQWARMAIPPGIVDFHADAQAPVHDIIDQLRALADERGGYAGNGSDLWKPVSPLPFADSPAGKHFQPPSPSSGSGALDLVGSGSLGNFRSSELDRQLAALDRVAEGSAPASSQSPFVAMRGKDPAVIKDMGKLLNGQGTANFENPNKWAEAAVKSLSPDDWMSLAQEAYPKAMAAGQFRHWGDVLNFIKEGMWKRFH